MESDTRQITQAAIASRRVSHAMVFPEVALRFGVYIRAIEGAWVQVKFHRPVAQSTVGWDALSWGVFVGFAVRKTALLAVSCSQLGLR